MQILLFCFHPRAHNNRSECQFGPRELFVQLFGH